MNKLEEKLKQLKKEKRIGLMTHVVVGYPSLDKTIEIVKVMAEYGVDFVELQIPFSDPLADGPTIMRACEKSLENGTTVNDAFSVMKQLSSEVSIPLLFMGYYNTVFTYGVQKFCHDAKKAGASGLIFPDFSLDEESHEHFIHYCGKNGLNNIQVVSPVSTDERLKKNTEAASGFVYCTAYQGTTGDENDKRSDLMAYLKKVKQIFSVPIAVGFGISNKQQIQSLYPAASVAIVGSAIIKEMDKNGVGGVKNFIQELLDK